MIARNTTSTAAAIPSTFRLADFHADLVRLVFLDVLVSLSPLLVTLVTLVASSVLFACLNGIASVLFARDEALRRQFPDRCHGTRFYAG